MSPKLRDWLLVLGGVMVALEAIQTPEDLAAWTPTWPTDPVKG